MAYFMKYNTKFTLKKDGDVILVSDNVNDELIGWSEFLKLPKDSSSVITFEYECFDDENNLIVHAIKRIQDAHLSALDTQDKTCLQKFCSKGISFTKNIPEIPFHITFKHHDVGTDSDDDC